MKQLGLFSGTEQIAIKPKRPVLRYYGSGWQRAAWTVAHFPTHDVYCEPCFGSGAVLFHKAPCKLEIANDLDNRVISFFKVLRESPSELIEKINLTPWHEAEYQQCLRPSPDPLEDARRFFFTCWANIKGGPAAGPSDFRWQKKQTRRSAAVKDTVNLDHLHTAARRLSNVQFLNQDALDVIRKMAGTGSLIYFDPPYLKSTRSRKSEGYRFEVTIDWHREAAELLRLHEGPLIVSGYASELYESLYEDYGWQRVDRPYRTNSGGSAVECLWLNPQTTESLNGHGG